MPATTPTTSATPASPSTGDTLRYRYPLEGRDEVYLVTRLIRKDGMFARAGWYWHYEALDPNGEALCGVARGPFVTEDNALRNAVRNEYLRFK